MLDKRTSLFLAYLARACSDGSYKIIEKNDLARELRGASDNLAVLDKTLRFLQDNEIIDIKYSDEKQIAVMVLPKGRVLHESGARKTTNGRASLSRKVILFLMLGTFLMAFAGGLIGVIVGSLVLC